MQDGWFVCVGKFLFITANQQTHGSKQQQQLEQHLAQGLEMCDQLQNSISSPSASAASSSSSHFCSIEQAIHHIASVRQLKQYLSNSQPDTASQPLLFDLSSSSSAASASSSSMSRNSPWTMPAETPVQTALTRLEAVKASLAADKTSGSSTGAGVRPANPCVNVLEQVI